MTAAENPQPEPRPGYCYHSALLSYKTETLLRKWREGWGNAKQRATIAWELSFRDPALALTEVKTRLGDPKLARQRKTLRLCLHHAADAATARELLAADDFDPDALHLAAFAALLEDFLAALPGLAPAAAEAQLRKLGFLAGTTPNPMVDAPRGSDAYDTSPHRYRQLLIRFLGEAFEAPTLAAFRHELGEHMRSICSADADPFLLGWWSRGELGATEVFAVVPRLGWERAEELIGNARLADLVEALAAELGQPPSRFEDEVLGYAWVAASARGFPPAPGRAVALAFLDTPRLENTHVCAAEALLELGIEGQRALIDRAHRLPPGLVARAAVSLDYADVLARLERGGVGMEHPALIDHPHAPPDLTLLAQAEDIAEIDPKRACALLERAARRARHPHHDAAFERLFGLARGTRGDHARRVAIHALGELGDPRATPTLLAALADPSLLDARLLVVTALALAADERAVPALRQLADESGTGAQNAIDAILLRAHERP